MARYAITGVSGYLGQRLLEQLAAEADVTHIVGIDRRPPSAMPAKMRFHVADVRDPGLHEILRHEKVDTLIHLAFILDPIHDLRLMSDINVNGTRNVLRSALGTAVEHVLVTSSVAAYGAWPDNPIPLMEEHPLRPNPDFQYSVDKAAIDLLCQEFASTHREMAVAIVRPTFVLGRHVNNYFSRYLRHWPALPVARGSDGPMQFVHEDDLVGLCLTILRRRAAGIFNLAGDGPLRWSEVIRRAGRIPVTVHAALVYPFVEALWRVHAPRIGGPASQFHFTRFPYVMSIAKAERELGYRPIYSTADALDSCRAGWYNPPKTLG